jgi:hypothetical protein
VALLRNAVAIALVSALAATGALSFHHLHGATPAHPTVVHAHVEGAAHADTHVPSSVDGEHEDAVPLNCVMAGGQARHVVGQPCALPQANLLAAVAASEPIGPDSDTRPTPSPPPRPSAPRAPPA